MIEKARVVETKGSLVRLEIKRGTACGDSCGSCKSGCAPTNTYVNAANSIGAKTGDYVEVEMSTKTFMNVVVLIYGLPLLMLLIGIFSGSTLVNILNLKINIEVARILLGFTLMALSYIFISKLDKRSSKKASINFEIKKIL